MDSDNWVMGIVLGIIVLVVIIVMCAIGFSIFGLHIDTGNGTHVGFITSTEKTGVIFKTMRAYVKTDTQSSQENAYCVLDRNVFTDLENAAAKHERVEVSYFSWIDAGVTNCSGEEDIINKVTVL